MLCRVSSDVEEGEINEADEHTGDAGDMTAHRVHRWLSVAMWAALRGDNSEAQAAFKAAAAAAQQCREVVVYTLLLLM